MNVIAFLINGLHLTCERCVRIHFNIGFGDCIASVRGSSVNYKCNSCGKTIPANRKPGKKNYRNLTKGAKL